jgi:hypothetical protein
MRPKMMYLFGTTWWNFLGLGIWWGQGWKKPMHVGCFFIMDDGSKVGFHAQYRVRGRELGGFVKFDFDQYEKGFHTRRARLSGKRIRKMHIPLSVDVASAKYARCIRLRNESKGYAHAQVLGKLLHEKRNVPLPTDPEYVDCSESMGLIMEHDTPVFDLREPTFNPNFDSITPYELWHGIERILYPNKFQA